MVNNYRFAPINLKISDKHWKWQPAPKCILFGQVNVRRVADCCFSGAQPVYANTVDLQRMALENQLRQQQEEEEKDGEATTPTTPSSLQSTQVRGAGNAGTIGEGRIGSTLGGEETVPSCLFQALILWVTFPFSFSLSVCMCVSVSLSLALLSTLYLFLFI